MAMIPVEIVVMHAKGFRPSGSCAPGHRQCTENSQIHDAPSLRKSCKSCFRRLQPRTPGYDDMLAILALPVSRY